MRKVRSVISVLIVGMVIFLSSCNDDKKDNSDPVFENESHFSTQSTGNTSQPTTPNTEEGKATNNCKLIVNGEDISSEVYVNIHFEKRYADIPFIAVMRALGGEVEWISPSTAKVIFNGKNYSLNTTECLFVEEGKSLNLMSTPPGGTRHYQVIGDEFILDDGTMSGAFQLMGFDIKIDRNFEEKIISIG